MTNDFILTFLNELETEYANAKNSSSIANYITLRSKDIRRHRKELQQAISQNKPIIEKGSELIDKIAAMFSQPEEHNSQNSYNQPPIDKSKGENVLAVLKSCAASARANLNEHHGKDAQWLIRDMIDQQTFGLSKDQKDTISKRAGEIVAEYGAQYGEDGAQRTLLSQITDMDISDKELFKHLHRASAFVSKHGELSEDELLAAYYITCEKLCGDLNEVQIRAIGYCAGMAQAVSDQVRKQMPMKGYDAFFADPDNTAYAFVGGFMLIVASKFIVKSVLKVTGAMMGPSIIALSIALIALYIFILDEMEHGRIRSFIESAKVHHQTCRIGRSTIRYASGCRDDKPNAPAAAEPETSRVSPVSAPVYA